MTDERTYQLAIAALYCHRVRIGLQMVQHYGSAQEAWLHIQDAKKEAAMQRALAEQEWMVRHDIRAHFCTDDSYPYRLKECPDSPLMIFTKGKAELNRGKFISIVGTRGATPRGRDLTRKLVLDLARLCPDVTIVSGLAYGIDIAAHRAALEAGLPTLIVPAHGLDRIYPTIHRPIAIEALREGGIVTEYMSGTSPEKLNFVARNRIVAGLSDAVVVTESRAQGGSLITANMAIDYDRELFTFPGRPTDIESEGCNQLIRDQRAQLILSAEDLVKAMQWESAPAQDVVEPTLFDETASLSLKEREVIKKIREQEDGIHINMIVLETSLPYREVASALMILEMQNLIQALPGGMYRAIK